MTPGEGNALELAARRLERAVGQLEQKITAERTARLTIEAAMLDRWFRALAS